MTDLRQLMFHGNKGYPEVQVGCISLPVRAEKVKKVHECVYQPCEPVSFTPPDLTSSSHFPIEACQHTFVFWEDMRLQTGAVDEADWCVCCVGRWTHEEHTGEQCHNSPFSGFQRLFNIYFIWNFQVQRDEIPFEINYACLWEENENILQARLE